MLRFLVDNGANAHIHAGDEDLWLHIIIKTFDDEDDALEAAKLLVSHGCDPFEEDSSGNTPLHIAIERGYIFIAQYLSSLGAPLPCDALFIAFQMHQHRLPMINFIITQGASVLTKALDGATAQQAFPTRPTTTIATKTILLRLSNISSSAVATLRHLTVMGKHCSTSP